MTLYNLFDNMIIKFINEYNLKRYSPSSVCKSGYRKLEEYSLGGILNPNRLRIGLYDNIYITNQMTSYIYK